MKVLVIGGTGFIGTWVVRSLLQKQVDVILYNRQQAEDLFPEDKVYHIRGDKASITQHQKAFRMLAPEVVIDMIPMTFQDGWRTLLALEDVAPRMVAISSSDVYRAYDIFRQPGARELEPIPLTENSPLRETLYPYQDLHDPALTDYDKIPVESLYKNAFKGKNTILRLPAVYGPGDKQLRFKEPISRILDKRRFMLLDKEEAGWRWTRGYVENIGEAIAVAATSEATAGKTYNLGEEKAHSVYEWAVRIAHHMSWQLEIMQAERKFLPAYQQTEFNYRQDMALDTSLFRNELQFSDPVPEEEGLRKTIEFQEWYFSKNRKPIPWDYRLEDRLYHKAYEEKLKG